MYDRERKLPTYVYMIPFFITKIYVNIKLFTYTEFFFAKQMR